jgi:hypothetical protein
MKTITNFFKSLWNFFFGKTKMRKSRSVRIVYDTRTALRARNADIQETVRPKPIRTLLFNKQQLKGKLFRNNGTTVRIGNNAKQPVRSMFKYEVEKLM